MSRCVCVCDGGRDEERKGESKRYKECTYSYATRMVCRPDSDLFIEHASARRCPVAPVFD